MDEEARDVAAKLTPARKRMLARVEAGKKTHGGCGSMADRAAASKALWWLEDAGLAKSRVVKPDTGTPYPHYTISTGFADLTELGRRVASILREEEDRGTT